MEYVGRTRLAKSCESRDDSLSWNLSRVKQGGATRADDMDPQAREQVHATARLNQSGLERPDRTRSCNDAKRVMDRHENDKKSRASTNKSLREANCVNMSVMGNCWDKKPED